MLKNKRINRANYFIGNRFHVRLHIISPKNLIYINSFIIGPFRFCCDSNVSLLVHSILIRTFSLHVKKFS